MRVGSGGGGGGLPPMRSFSSSHMDCNDSTILTSGPASANGIRTSCRCAVKAVQAVLLCIASFAKGTRHTNHAKYLCALLDMPALRVLIVKSKSSFTCVIASICGYLLPVENVFYTGIDLQLALALPFRQPAKPTQAVVSSDSTVKHEP